MEHIKRNDDGQCNESYYGRYLEEKYKTEEREQYQKEFYSNLSQKTIEYTEFLCFILEQTDWDNSLILIRQEEWDRFWNSDIEDDEIAMTMFKAKYFYEEFEKITGVDYWKFEECFVSTKYIDERSYNTMNLIIDIDGKRERFIIDVE